MPSFMVGHQSHVLRRRQPVDALEDELVDGWLERVRVLSTPKYKMYVGVVRELHFDPSRFSFSTAGSLHSYTVKKGRAMLTKRAQLSRPIPDKWHGALSTTYVPCWCELWHKNRPQKEAGFSLVGLSMCGGGPLLAHTGGARDFHPLHQLHCRPGRIDPSSFSSVRNSPRMEIRTDNHVHGVRYSIHYNKTW